MWNRKLPRQEPGKPIAAATINRTADAAEWATRIQVTPPLGIFANAFGPVLAYVGPIFGFYVAVVGSGGISARSGNYPGSGTVSLCNWNGTELTTTSKTKTVYNLSSTSGGISSGKYCAIIRWMSAYWIITAEC